MCAKSFITNLSGKDLSDPQILLLSKGLSFIPTARNASNFELLRDLDQFCKRIRTFSRMRYNKTICKNFPPRRINKHHTMRTYFSNAKLEGVLEAMKIEISQIYSTDNPPPNLTPSERKALRELKHDKDLVINKADKGSTIVVQNRTDYISTANKTNKNIKNFWLEQDYHLWTVIQKLAP